VKRQTLPLLVVLGLLAPVGARAQAADAPRVLPIHDSVWLEELTWLEVRDLMAQGKRTVLIPTGGVEQNGPYLVTGKHNIVLRASMEAAARKLGNALIAPIVPFVPEGDFYPKEPTGWMRYPGTVAVTEQTFRALLTDIARSMKTHGFDSVVLLGDSGSNQDGMEAVAETLSKEWAGTGTTIAFIPEYYDNARVTAWLEQQGIHEVSEGDHDTVHYTVTMMLVDPQSVRADVRRGAGLFTTNGVDLKSIRESQEIGRRLVDFQSDYTVDAIRRRLGEHVSTGSR
jgi:creatinine amidohydrolase/Fe(II)-dependent formamide hydrolase-like protein